MATTTATPTIAQIREAQREYVNGGGGDDGSLQARYYARPVSYLVAWVLIRLGVTANAVTTSALLLAAVGGILIIFGSVLLGAIVLNVGHLLDYVDGTIAKATGTVSKFGMYLDMVCDEAVETIIPLAIGVALIDVNVLFPILGFVCAIFHLLGAVTFSYSKEVYGKPERDVTMGGGIMKLLALVGTNIKSCAVPLLVVATIVPGGMAVFLVGLTALALGEFAVRLFVGGKG